MCATGLTKYERFLPVISQEIRLKDGSSITLRPARPADAAKVLDLSRAVWAERIYTVTESSIFTVSQQAAMISALEDGDLFLLAEREGALIGILTAYPYMRGRSPKVAHVVEFGMCVRADSRSQGVGAAMLTYLDLWAPTRGYEKICLAVFSTNERAIHLYRKAGYQEEGRRTDQFKLDGVYIDEILMGKRISG